MSYEDYYDVSNLDLEDALMEDEEFRNFTKMIQMEEEARRKYHEQHGLPPHEMKPQDLALMVVSTVATGFFLALILWAVADIYARKRTLHTISNNILTMLSLALVLMAFLDVGEYFLVYDFMFHRNIHWAIHNEWLADLYSFCRSEQDGLIFALCIHQTLSLFQWFKGTCGCCFQWSLFLSNAFLHPSLMLILQKTRLLPMMYYVYVIPFVSTLFLFLLLFFVCKRKLLKLSFQDVVATKVIILYLVVIMTHYMFSIFTGLVSLCAQIHQDWIFYFVVETIRALAKQMFPVLYLVMFRYESLALRVLPCLNNGMERLASSGGDDHHLTPNSETNPHHHVPVSVAFPVSLFSISTNQEAQHHRLGDVDNNELNLLVPEQR